jgi:lysophospholipase L1-like esterase
MVMLLSPGKLTFSPEFEIKIFSFEDVLSKSVASTDITEIIAFEEQVDAVVKEAAQAKPSNAEEPENVEVKGENPLVDGKTNSRFPIEFPRSSPHALDQFFYSLQLLSSEQPFLRIIHYGDSQLEGDRISDYLRNRFQQRFGGCGVGMVPITEINNLRGTIKQESSPNWVKYTIYGAERKQPIHKNYSTLGSYFTLFDQTLPKSQEEHTGWVRYNKVASTYSNFNEVQQIRLFYRERRETLAVSFAYNNQEPRTDTLPPVQGFGVKKYPVKEPFSTLRLQMSSKGTPDIFGVSFDCHAGIALDNVAMRGSSGLEFTQINQSFLKEQFEKLQVKFLIVQFGVNVIPNVQDDYSFYEYSMTRQLNYLKSLVPGVDILVIGVSDMSRKKGTEFESYPNIEMVRNAQKAAAFEAGCAFWDLYKAMGGKNSMISWVNANPPLASTDYTHFSPRGARLIAEILYNELMYEYEQYKQRAKAL